MASGEATVRAILERNGLPSPDGRALYAYRTTAGQVEALRSELRAGASAMRPDTLRSAALCMFIAEHVRRNHEGGPWTWRDAIEACAFRGSVQELYGAVLRGLAYWRRPLLVSGSDRQFLLTLMCEGGLPLRLLKRDNQRLTAYFRELLAARETFSHTPTSLLALRCADRLPAMLRQDVVFELGGQLIDVVASLRVAAASATNPVRALDTFKPNWRDEVPLSIEDDIAFALLEGLLRSPAPGAVKVSQLALHTVLRLGASPLRMERLLHFPADMSRQELAQQLSLSPEALPSRVYLHLLEHDGTRHHVAVATAMADERFTVQRVASPRLHREAALLNAIRLVASVGSRDIATTVPPGGEALPAVPWVFLDTDPPRLLAAGAAQTRSDTLLIAFGEGSVVTTSGLLEEVGTVPMLNRRIMRLRGEAAWAGDEGRCLVRTAYAGPESSTYTLSGAVRSYGFAGAELWSEVPQVMEFASDGCSKVVTQEAVQFRSVRPGSPWVPRASRPRGTLQLRVTEDGEVRFATRLTVVPADLRLSLSTSGSARGAIVVHGSGIINVGVAPLPQVRAAVSESLDGTFRIDVEAEQPTPARVEIVLQFQGGGEARLQSPFPVWSRYFAGLSGEPVADSRLVAMHGLAGLTARAVSLHPHILEGRLEGERWEYLGRLRTVGEACAELSLEAVRDRIEGLFASSANLDALVELRLVEESGLGDPQAPTLRVRRYDAFLAPASAPGATRLVLRTYGDDHLIKSLDGVLRVDAVPLWRLAEQPSTLSQAEDRSFVFEHAGRAAGPWLMLGWEGDHLRLRPLMVTVQGGLSAHPRTPLEEAVRTSQLSERYERMRNVVASLAENYGDEAWPQVFGFLDALDRYPVTTFDVVKALASNDDAMALALLKTDVRHFERFWTTMEELPFMWAIVPLRSWLNAARQMSRWAESIYRDLGWSRRQLVSDRLDVFRAKARHLGAFTSTLLAVLPYLIQDAPAADEHFLVMARTAEGRAQLRRGVLTAQLQDLLRRHPDGDGPSDQRWPVFHVDDVLDDRTALRSWFDRHRVACPPGVGFRRGALDVPVLAAAMSHAAERPSDAHLRAMRRARAFDEPWFDFAHAFAWTCMLGERLENDRDALDRI